MHDPGPVLITGCSTGIGHATAERLARSGHTVYATARRTSGLDDLAEAGATLLELDVTDEGSMQEAVERIDTDHGGVGSLINNAGYSRSGAVETVPIDDVRGQFETNVFGLVRMSQLVLPGMRDRGSGRIVNISSMGANFTFPGGGYYHATKYAVEAISDALRFEVQGFGVDVVIVQPGIIRTNFDQTAVASMAAEEAGAYGDFNSAVAEATKSVYESGPMARLGGGPGKVAAVIEKALTADRPKIRYRVTPSAHLLIGQRKLMTDGLWDRFLRTQFPRPGRT